MDAKTLAALKASIAHWEENVAAEKPEDASTGVGDCALCQRFRRYECFGCPVADASGRTNCRGTPYIKAEKACRGWFIDGGTGEDFRQAAQAELEFLRSLLPEGEQ